MSCQHPFHSRHTLNLHISHKPECRNGIAAQRARQTAGNRQNVWAPDESLDMDPPVYWHEDAPPEHIQPFAAIFRETHLKNNQVSELTTHGASPVADEVSTLVNDPGCEPNDLFVEKYPGLVGATYGTQKTYFEDLEEMQKAGQIGKFEPFDDRLDWELAQWLMTSGTSHTDIDRLLKLDTVRLFTLCSEPDQLIVRQIRIRAKPSFQDKRTLLDKIDLLPQGPTWQCMSFTVDGVSQESHEQEELDIWCRNPVECVQELIGNPDFHKSLHYAPERHFVSEDKQEQIINEMWTAEWWWNTQVSVLLVIRALTHLLSQEKLLEGATIAPIILASDKTQLSQFSGDKQAWPVYLSIGNLERAIRRQPSKRGTIFVGYLQVMKQETLAQDRNQAQGRSYRLFHFCMSKLMLPLIEAGKNGVLMTSADNQIRCVFPILASYIAGYPEQCLVAGNMENSCPICEIKPAD